MKKITYSLIFMLILALFAGSLSSCNKNKDDETPTAVTEGQFENALKVKDKNLTIDIRAEYDGDVMTAQVKVVDNKAYYTSQFDSCWVDYTDSELFTILEQMAESFSSFSYADGTYTLAELVYTYDDYEYKVVNLSCKVLSSGKLSEVYFEMPEEDCNRMYKLTFSGYNSTSAPSSSDMIPEGGNGSTSGDNSGSTSNGGNSSIQPGGDSVGGENGDGNFSSVSEEAWRKAFAFSGMDFCADFKSNSPNGYSESRYLIVDGEGYYTIDDENDWVRGSVEEFTRNFAPFIDLYSDFEFDGIKYKCSESSYIPGNNAKIIDLEATFDENGRLVHFGYTLVLGDEQGRMDVFIYDYDNVTAPELSDSSSSSSNNSSSSDAPGSTDDKTHP